MSAQAILKELRPLGSARYRNVLYNHGVQDPVFGVKMSELKKIQKRVRKDYKLALELFDTGVFDAMSLAALIADDARMTKKDLRHWVEKANCAALRECAVAWVAAESPHGYELALEWIESTQERVASVGWATLSGIVAITPDEKLDLARLRKLLQWIEKSIHDQPNRVRYVMNGFVIAAGAYVSALTQPALRTAAKIGSVAVDVGNTACKVPDAGEYIKKIEQRGAIGRKRKTVKC